MKRICFVNGSPKGETSSSNTLLKEVNTMVSDNEYSKYFINVTKSLKASQKNLEDDFIEMINADAVIFAFPLYVDCLPSIFIRFLHEFYEFAVKINSSNRNTKIYAIINCGFPEPSQNSNALRIMKNFCTKLNYKWRFGIGIGMGGMIGSTKDVPFKSGLKREVYNGLHDIFKDIEEEIKGEKEDLYVRFKFPKRLYLFMGSKGWISSAKKNGLKKNQLYRKTYYSS